MITEYVHEPISIEGYAETWKSTYKKQCQLFQSDVHELQLCEKEADNDQSQPEWPVISGCHIMKQSMFTFLWWCLNITLKCLWFFPRHAANSTMAFCGVGVDGTQLSRLRRAPPPCTQTPIYSTNRQGRASSPSGDIPAPRSLKSWFKIIELRTHPRDSTYGTCLESLPCFLEQTSELPCIVI